MLRALVALGLLMFAAPASAAPASRIQIDFYTPGNAVMCWEDYHEIQLQCFTPNDDFSIFMFPTGRVPKHGAEHPFSGAPAKNPVYRQWKLKDFNLNTGALLQFGHRWTEWQALKNQYSCLSQKTGLICKNRSGHGWWLGRYKGFRIF